eukprot:7701705-Alexandrium_andersonii.AAC.1
MHFRYCPKWHGAIRALSGSFKHVRALSRAFAQFEAKLPEGVRTHAKAPEAARGVPEIAPCSFG